MRVEYGPSIIVKLRWETSINKIMECPTESLNVKNKVTELICGIFFPHMFPFLALFLHFSFNSFPTVLP